MTPCLNANYWIVIPTSSNPIPVLDENPISADPVQDCSACGYGATFPIDV
jgi:hypothetical protein